MSRNDGGNYTNPCLTMHQPWASLLVLGIKRIEGRSWPAPIRGRLWIHAASKIPEPETIKAMEDFYREIYAVNGIKGLKFPENYPTSRLLGCVEVVGCIKCEELQCWEELPEGVRLEGQTEYCWLCEQPQKLLIPFEMRGNQRVFNLERKIYEAAVRGLRPVEAPYPVKFPLVDARDPFSLKPGSLTCLSNTSNTSALGKSSSLSNVIAGARVAAKQFSREHKGDASVNYEVEIPISSRTRNKLKDKVQNEENVPDDADSSLITEDSCIGIPLLKLKIVVGPWRKRNPCISCRSSARDSMPCRSSQNFSQITRSQINCAAQGGEGAIREETSGTASRPP